MALINLSKIYPVLIDTLYQKYSRSHANIRSKLSVSFLKELDTVLKPFNGKICRGISISYIWAEFDSEHDLLHYLLVC